MYNLVGINNIMNDVAKIDNLPDKHTIEALLLMRHAWSNVDAVSVFFFIYVFFSTDTLFLFLIIFRFRLFSVHLLRRPLQMDCQSLLLLDVVARDLRRVDGCGPLREQHLIDKQR